MRATRACLAGALALTLGCAPTEELDELGGGQAGEPDLGAVYQNVDALIGSCTFVSGVVTVSSDADQTLFISKRPVDSVILVNGETCTTTTMPPVAATSSKMKKLVVRGSSADESLILDFGGGLFAPGIANATSGGIAVDLGGGTDMVSVQTTSSADTLYVGADGLAFNSDRYKDVTFANVESLRIVLGAGNDTVTATNAVPTKGVSGAATLPLTIYGGAGNDVIVGGAQVDTIYGGPGNDTLSGGAGNDSLYGDEGADIMHGGTAADGDDQLDCGDESPSNTSIDLVSYDKRSAPINAAAGSPGTGGESGEVDSIAANCEGITGGSANDTLVGDANKNVLSGGPGDDALTGGGGDDTLNGGPGNDTFDEGASASGGDVIIGGLGTDLVDYSARSTNLTVTMDGAAADDGAANEGDNVKADVENLRGGAGNDTITGNTLANEITGGGGDDRLSGGPGNDVFLEGASANGKDTIAGGVGIDLVDYSARSGDLTITMGDALANDGESGELDDIGSDVENLKAGSGDDTVTGNALANSILGGAGNDTLRGGDGDDTLDGSDGGSAVNDLTCGEGADLALNYGAGTVAPDCELRGI